MAKNWIQRAIRRPGSFARKAKAAGMSTSQFARRVLANPKKYSPATRKQAGLAKTLSGMRRRR